MMNMLFVTILLEITVASVILVMSVMVTPVKVFLSCVTLSTSQFQTRNNTMLCVSS